MSPPLVSVIIPVGPLHAEHARTAAASVQAQTMAARCETILIPDGGAVVPPLPGVRMLPPNPTRRGPAVTRNRGIAAAQGAFILPLDADDYLLPHAVENLLREYARGMYGYIYGDAYTQERDGTFIYRSAPDYIQDHMRRYNQHVITALVPTAAWRMVGGYDEGVDAWEDWSGHLRLAIAGVCGRRIPVPTLTYRVYEGDRMTKFYGGAPELMERVLVRYRNNTGEIPMAGCCGGDPGLAQLAQQAVANVPSPEGIAVAGDRIRIEYLGEERGSIPFDLGQGRTIKLGNNAMNRFADVSQAEYEFLKGMLPLRVVPQFDQPVAPAALRPIVQPLDVLTEDAVKALRP